MTQCDSILEWMTRGNTITSRQAIELFGCTRLAARVSDLRAMGHNVSKRTKTVKNRYGRTCNVAEYYIEGE